jgi:beta-lactamase family protein
VIAAPPPPVVDAPAAYQLSYGVVAGTAAPGTRRVLVRVGKRVVADRPVRQRHFELRVPLPAAERSVTVVTVRTDGRRSSTRIDHVLGAAATAEPRLHGGHVDPVLTRELRLLADGFGTTSGIYVQNLVTGAGAAWNARATFPGASALKLAVAVTALAREGETPAPGSALDGLLRKMLVLSSNDAANGVERFFGGSTSGGSALVDELLRSIGLQDTEMYGGYELDPSERRSRRLAGPIPIRVDNQPSWGVGKRTTAYDLASLMRGVWLASVGRGPLRAAQPGFSGSDARYLLYLLAQVRDPGKVDREVGRLPGVLVLHKAGWIDNARHDNALVLWPGGAIVVTVMTYRYGGAGIDSDVLAGRVAAVALRHFRG